MYLSVFLSRCTYPTVLQERIDREVRGVAAETEPAAAAAGANGVSDVAGSGEEPAEGDGDKVEQVTDGDGLDSALSLNPEYKNDKKKRTATNNPPCSTFSLLADEASAGTHVQAAPR